MAAPGKDITVQESDWNCVLLVTPNSNKKPFDGERVRKALMIPTLLRAAVLVFVLMRLIPGDICVMRLATGGGINPEVLKTCRLELGMDRPVLLMAFPLIILA